MSSLVKLIVHFVIHILVAAVLFGVLTFAAYCLWWFTEWLKSIGAPYEIWIVSYVVSELVFWLDALCFVVFVSAEVYKLIREIIAEARK
jgi:hypothetical protein